MIIDARQQFEKEPKSFGNKRNRMTETQFQWIEERYREGWKESYADDNVKIFKEKEEYKRQQAEGAIAPIRRLLKEGDKSVGGQEMHETMKGIQTQKQLGM